MLNAVGVEPDGRRKVLGVSVLLGEQEVHWRAFMESPGKRGLLSVRQTVLGGLPWKRCQFHLQQNAQAYIPRKEMQAEVAEDIRNIFNAPDRPTAECYLAETVKKYECH